MYDALGDRMKAYYENRTRYMLTRRIYTMIRIDGKAFHSYTKGLEKPFDYQLMSDMDETAKFLCKQIQCARLAFVQSDEISILLTDFENLQTALWFDGNIQKMASVSASAATYQFNLLRPGKMALFDARVFQLPSWTEAQNYFIWRQQDATRNSILSAAQSVYSAKEMVGKKTNELQEMLFQKGINWNDYPVGAKRGRIIEKETYEKDPNVIRTRWVAVEPPVFTQEREFLESRIAKSN